MRSLVDTNVQGAHVGAPLHRVVQWFKTMTTNEYAREVRRSGWTPFPGRLWQRGYYEHVVRTESELNQVRQYILDNPAKWLEDEDNPRNW
ncbi:MAG: transposase [Dehalococcoidia bacterium]